MEKLSLSGGVHITRVDCSGSRLVELQSLCQANLPVIVEEHYHREHTTQYTITEEEKLIATIAAMTASGHLT